MECLHFEVLGAYFCPCFLTQLTCLKNSTFYSDRILRYVTYKNLVPEVIEVLETCHIVLIICFEHLFTQLAYLKIGMNFLYYNRRTFPKFEFERKETKKQYFNIALDASEEHFIVKLIFYIVFILFHRFCCLRRLFKIMLDKSYRKDTSHKIFVLVNTCWRRVDYILKMSSV